jgi:hypothetical protein
MRDVDVVAGEDGDAPAAQLVDRLDDGGEGEVGAVTEGEGDDGQALADRFDDEAEREGVGDAGGPFGEGVAGGRSDNMASAGGSSSGVPGSLYSERTVCPVRAVRASTSRKRRPSGEAMTHTSQPSA